MASGLSAVAAALVLCVALSPCVYAWDNDCKSYTDNTYTYHSSQSCSFGSFCCGSCFSRYCCSSTFQRLSEDEQDDCKKSYFLSSPLPMILGIGFSIIAVLIFICCCVCPCCCLYKMCRKPRPVITTTTHTTVVTATPQQYPQQPVAASGQTPGYQYPPYQATSVQPGYGTHPMPQSYGAQPMSTVPYQGQPYAVGPPPTYQEATGPVYLPNPMPYSQAAFIPGQTPYPLQPPVQLQPNAPPHHTDLLTQPAYNPDYVSPHPKTG